MALTNKAGHRIPDGCLWSGRVVLEVTAKDEKGDVLFNNEKEYLGIGLDVDGYMRYGA